MFIFIDFLKAHIKRDETQALRAVDKMTEPEARHLNQMLQNVGWDAKALLLRLKAQPTLKKASAAKRCVIITTVTIPAEKKSPGKQPVRVRR